MPPKKRSRKMNFSNELASLSIERGHLPQVGTWVWRDGFESVGLDVDFVETCIFSSAESTLTFFVLHLK